MIGSAAAAAGEHEAAQAQEREGSAFFTFTGDEQVLPRRMPRVGMDRPRRSGPLNTNIGLRGASVRRPVWLTSNAGVLSLARIGGPEHLLRQRCAAMTQLRPHDCLACARAAQLELGTSAS